MKEPSMFASAADAIKFALRYQAQKVARPSYNKMAAPSSGRSKLDLGGLEIPGMAGFILAELKALEPYQIAYLIVRYATPHHPCSCGSLCCSGRRPNDLWTNALLDVTGHVGDIVYAPSRRKPDEKRERMKQDSEAFQTTMEKVVRSRQEKYSIKGLHNGLIRKYLGHRVNLGDLGKQCYVSDVTVTNHRKRIDKILADLHKEALTAFSKRLVNAGIVGNTH